MAAEPIESRTVEVREHLDKHLAEGKVFRKATPGGWREDLTSEQVDVVERITAPLLDEFYPEWKSERSISH